ncbi:brevican core protein-like [Anneissia japonica]|uniref:brevican core protein-like n=1 Tax=Anneissia japonica TaxID=1529436 RepID=UPI0014255630|nr:brevican core protein-like [Anneissia japonica]
MDITHRKNTEQRIFEQHCFQWPVKDGIYFIAREDDYKNAAASCRYQLGSIASYELLYNAFQPSLENCKEGWLISGEIAFTELKDACILKPPEQRSNVFPCQSYQSGVYCHKEYNTSADILDYLPKTQRIIRLTNSNSKMLNAEDAKICCSTKFNGQLATPLNVYNNSLSLGVNLCGNGWLSGMLEGNPCEGHTPPDFWLYPAGNFIRFKPLTGDSQAFCLVPLANQSYIDPFPSHRVMSGQGQGRHTLNYYDADALCKSRGGRIASKIEVEYAQQSGYDVCEFGWVKNGEIVYPVVQPRSGCANIPTVVNVGFKDKTTFTAMAYCYM